MAESKKKPTSGRKGDQKMKPYLVQTKKHLKRDAFLSFKAPIRRNVVQWDTVPIETSSILASYQSFTNNKRTSVEVLLLFIKAPIRRRLVQWDSPPIDPFDSACHFILKNKKSLIEMSDFSFFKAPIRRNVVQWDTVPIETSSILASYQSFINNKRTSEEVLLLFIKAPIRIELMNKGFADLCLTAWLWRRNALYYITDIPLCQEYFKTFPKNFATNFSMFYSRFCYFMKKSQREVDLSTLYIDTTHIICYNP